MNKVHKVDTAIEQKLRKDLEKIDFEFSHVDYAFWRASRAGIVLTFYKKGTLMIQGQDIDEMNDYLSEGGFLGVEESSQYSSWIGTDESGKGDYFGSLVIGGVMINDKVKDAIFEIGVRDSKNISDGQIKELAIKIKKLTCHTVVSINPLKYNELIGRIGNLNDLLAWGHARAIENILMEEDCEYAISDKFGNEKYLNNALMENGKKIKLKQIEDAEDDMGVACASILARDLFVKSIEKLSRDYGFDFPKGASSEMIVEIGKEFVAKYGKDKLKEVAKIHWKTTKKILG